MYATVTTWQLGDTLRDRALRRQVTRGVVAAGITKARDAGAIDLVMIELEPDRLMAVSLFDTLEEAETAPALARQFTHEPYLGALTLISRTTGQAYDPGEVLTLNRAAVQAWRTEVAAMACSLVTWRLDPSVRRPEEVAAYLRQIWKRYLARLVPIGLFDVVVVRIADETLLAIRLYAEPVEGNPAYQEAVAGVDEMLAGKVAFVEKRVGRAFDVPHLLELDRERPPRSSA